MIGRCIRMALLAAMLVAGSASAVEVAGVTIEDRIAAGNAELLLNGAGIRSRVFVKVYVGALYVTQKSNSPAAIVDATTPRRMVLRMLRDIDADALLNALRDGLKDNNSESELAALKPAIDQFADIMKRVGNARTGDVIAIDFLSGGIGVSLNREPRGKVASEAFSRALLRVWLGENPVDGALKKSLLGG